MADHRTDFARLARLQRVIKSLREREVAEATSRSAAAEETLQDLDKMLRENGPIVGLFPDLVARRLENTVVEKAEADRKLRESGDELLKEKKKLETIERRHGEQRAADNRQNEEAAQTESLNQRAAQKLSASSKLGKLG